jgi:hypothetical protein
MSEAARCGECGSWDRQCASSTPVPGCGCARCTRAALAAVEAESEGRRRALLAKAEELATQWRRAENAEAEIARLQIKLGEWESRRAAVASEILGIRTP